MPVKWLYKMDKNVYNLNTTKHKKRKHNLQDTLFVTLPGQGTNCCAERKKTGPNLRPVIYVMSDFIGDDPSDKRKFVYSSFAFCEEYWLVFLNAIFYGHRRKGVIYEIP